MPHQDPILIARGLIERHGIRAMALAEERLQEARLSGDSTELEHWQAVAAATAELRRTARQTRPAMH